MTTIITENPVTGRLIAGVVGATEKHGGYLRGNGYAVVWTGGEILKLVQTKAHGHFKFVVHDDAAKRQLGIIRRALHQSISVINALDASPEGELNFRNIYAHLGCKLPVKRLWLRALTGENVEKCMRDLHEEKEFDNLFQTADCRAKADLIVGNNMFNLGWSEAPALAMICSRWLETRDFRSQNYIELTVTAVKNGRSIKFRCAEKSTQEPAIIGTEAIVTKVDKTTAQAPVPPLYNLLELQKDCFAMHALLPARTLEIARSLYEKGLISHPQTTCNKIPRELATEVPSLLRMILRMTRFAHLAANLNVTKLSQKNFTKIPAASHHAIIITGNYPADLTTPEREIYDIICERMLQSFSPKNEEITTNIEVVSDGKIFTADTEIDLAGGETLPVVGHSLAHLKTMPKPFHNDISLISSTNLITPKTIENLLQKALIERSDTALIPTTKGLKIYREIKYSRLADTESANKFARELTDIKSIKKYAKQLAEEISQLPLKCPKCGANGIKIHHKIVKCNHCNLTFRRRFLNKELTETDIKTLLKSGQTNPIRGFHGKGPATFTARITFDKNYNLRFLE